MSYQLGLPAALAARGLKVEVVPGWETRSAGSFNPKGSVSHWTAGPRGATGRPSLNVVVNGRPDLQGPLCNVYLDRDGVAVVVAAGRANHAGEGGWKGLVGNSSVFGTEAECAGDGDWTDAQREAYPKVNAAYCDLGGFGVDMVCGHEEWAPTRKIDIRDYTMPVMRRDTAAVLAGEEDDMASPETIDAIAQRVRQVLIDGSKGWSLTHIQGIVEATDSRVVALGQAIAKLGAPAAVAAELAKLLPKGGAPTQDQVTEALRQLLGIPDAA